jgi:hypothetical protein
VVAVVVVVEAGARSSSSRSSPSFMRGGHDRRGPRAARLGAGPSIATATASNSATTGSLASPNTTHHSTRQSEIIQIFRYAERCQLEPDRLRRTHVACGRRRNRIRRHKVSLLQMQDWT